MKKRASRIGGVAFALLVLTQEVALAGAPEGDPQRAAESFRAARAAFEHGDFAQAGALFEAANTLSPHPTVLLNAAEAWELGGKPARAAEAYDAVIAGGDAKYAPSATARLARLEPENRDGRLPGVSFVARAYRRRRGVSPGAAPAPLRRYTLLDGHRAHDLTGAAEPHTEGGRAHARRARRARRPCTAARATASRGPRRTRRVFNVDVGLAPRPFPRRVRHRRSLGRRRSDLRRTDARRAGRLQRATDAGHT